MSTDVKWIAIAGACLALLVTAAYWNHFDNAFHFDDSHVIVSNAAIKDLSLWQTYFTDAATHSSLPTNQGYRPLLTLSFAVDYWLAGNTLNPFHFHLSTFLWFLLQAVLMFFLLLHIMNKAWPYALNPWAALFAVGYYCLNTVNAETINYISARSDVLSTVPVIAGMLIFMKTSGWKRHLSLIPVAVGILVKPTAVMYLPIMLAYVLLFDLRLSVADVFNPKHWRMLLIYGIPAAILCLGLYVFTAKMTPETWVPGGNSAFLYAITQPFVVLRYFFIFVVPIGLSADSDWKLLESVFDARFFFGMLFLAAMGAAIYRTSAIERQRPIAFGLLWFLFALIPTSSIIPLSEVTNDHRVFFPYVGLILAITWPVTLWCYSRLKAQPKSIGKLKRTAIIASCVIFFSHAYGVHQRNDVWHSGESLWHDVSIKSPNNGRGLMNYGLALMGKSDHAGALRYYQKALKTDYRNHPYLYLNMAAAQQGLGNVQVVEGLYKTALQNGYNYPDCHYYYAHWLWKNNRLSEADFHVKEALRLSSGHEYAQWLQGILGNATVSLLEQAIKTAELTPTPENYLNLSLQLYRSDDFKGCIKACEVALALRPDYADAWNNICSAYNAMGRWKEGVAACEKAIALQPDYPLAKNNLNWAKSGLNKKAQ